MFLTVRYPDGKTINKVAWIVKKKDEPKKTPPGRWGFTREFGGYLLKNPNCQDRDLVGSSPDEENEYFVAFMVAYSPEIDHVSNSIENVKEKGGGGP